MNSFCIIILTILIFSCGANNSKTVIDPDFIDTTTTRGGKGKTMFMQNCASCHSIMKESFGPALVKVIKGRDSAWIYKFLTNRKVIENDKAYLRRKKEFAGYECQIFTSLTQENVGEILQYIEEYQNPHYRPY